MSAQPVGSPISGSVPPVKPTQPGSAPDIINFFGGAPSFPSSTLDGRAHDITRQVAEESHEDEDQVERMEGEGPVHEVGRVSHAEVEDPDSSGGESYDGKGSQAGVAPDAASTDFAPIPSPVAETGSRSHDDPASGSEDNPSIAETGSRAHDDPASGSEDNPSIAETGSRAHDDPASGSEDHPPVAKTGSRAHDDPASGSEDHPPVPETGSYAYDASGSDDHLPGSEFDFDQLCAAAERRRGKKLSAMDERLTTLSQQVARLQTQLAQQPQLQAQAPQPQSNFVANGVIGVAALVTLFSSWAIYSDERN